MDEVTSVIMAGDNYFVNVYALGNLKPPLTVSVIPEQNACDLMKGGYTDFSCLPIYAADSDNDEANGPTGTLNNNENTLMKTVSSYNNSRGGRFISSPVPSSPSSTELPPSTTQQTLHIKTGDKTFLMPPNSFTKPQRYSSNLLNSFQNFHFNKSLTPSIKDKFPIPKIPAFIRKPITDTYGQSQTPLPNPVGAPIQNKSSTGINVQINDDNLEVDSNLHNQQGLSRDSDANILDGGPGSDCPDTRGYGDNEGERRGVNDIVNQQLYGILQNQLDFWENRAARDEIEKERLREEKQRLLESFVEDRNKMCSIIDAEDDSSRNKERPTSFANALKCLDSVSLYTGRDFQRNPP